MEALRIILRTKIESWESQAASWEKQARECELRAERCKSWARVAIVPAEQELEDEAEWHIAEAKVYRDLASIATDNVAELKSRLVPTE
jgi:hypothetical protein